MRRIEDRATQDVSAKKIKAVDNFDTANKVSVLVGFSQSLT
jgi:hypothetical protein